jgi:hypothetical protein
MPLKKIVSGGQTGADIAGIDAAIAYKIPHGGWLPKGRLTEDGPLPEQYNLQEMPTASYPKRTAQNVIDSDGTVIFTHGTLTGGSLRTRKKAEAAKNNARVLEQIVVAEGNEALPSPPEIITKPEAQAIESVGVKIAWTTRKQRLAIILPKIINIGSIPRNASFMAKRNWPKASWREAGQALQVSHSAATSRFCHITACGGEMEEEEQLTLPPEENRRES